MSSSVVVWPWTPQDQRLAPKKISVRHDQKHDNEMAIIEFSLKLGIYQLELDRLEWLYIHVVDYSSKGTDQDQGLQLLSNKQLSLV